MRVTRRLPVWLLGFANLPLGITGAVALLITPQVLAARHIPETQISNITTLGLAGTLAFFVLAPVLDVRFSRRTYALVMTAGASLLTFVSVMSFQSPGLLGLWLFVALLIANLNSSAIGGWFGSVFPPEYDAPLGAWMTVANTGGFGVTAIIGVLLVSHASLWLAAITLAGLNVLPLLIILAVEPPSQERRKAAESFGRFRTEVVELARRSEVRRLMMLFGLPCASFALTNTLGGLGADYGASAGLIAAIAGVGLTLAGILGSLSVPVLSRRASLMVVYLGIGIVGGLSTLSLLVLPRTPAVFTVAFVSQNVWQSASIATGFALTLSSIGKNNPLASTQFAILIAALSAPITYMQWIDGHAYGAGGLTALYLTDGGADLLACGLMTFLFLCVWSGARAALAPQGASNQ